MFSKHPHSCIFKQSSIINQRPPYSPPSWEAHACLPDLDLRKMQPLAAPGPPTTTFATSSTIDNPSSFYFYYFYYYYYLYCHYWQPLLGRSCPETFLHQIPVAALFYQLMTICFFSLLRHKSWNELIVLEDHACPWKVLIKWWQNHGWLYQANWALLQAYDRQI